MTTSDTLQRIYQQIERIPPHQLGLLAEFLNFLQFQENNLSPPGHTSRRKPGLHPGAFVMTEDFNDPLPDSFWLGEE